MMELKQNRSAERKARAVVLKAKEAGWEVSEQRHDTVLMSPAGGHPPLAIPRWPTKRKLNTMIGKMVELGFKSGNDDSSEEED